MTYKQNRFRRQKDVPEFFGVTRGFFNKFIRPELTEIWLGNTPQAGIVYDIIDLHALADRIKASNGRPATKGDNRWDVEQQVSNLSNVRVIPTGTLKERSSKDELDKALAQLRNKKQF